MASAKSALELLFDRLHHSQHHFIPEILQDVIDEYRVMIGELDKDERRKVNYIKSMIDYCNAENWVFARNQLEPAEEEYYRYFFRKISPAKLNKKASVRFFSDISTNKDSRRASVNSDKPRPSSYTNFPQKDIAARPNSENILHATRRTGRVTDLSDLGTPQKISEKFGQIFKNEWVDALDELEHLKIYEKHAINCLLRIVLDAYRVCVVEADTQIAKLEDAASSIMLEGNYTHGGKLKGHKSFLIEYRRGIADICVERLQETFRRRYLPEIIRSVGVYQNIRTHGYVLLYANQCVAICWAMAVLDPQVFLVDDRDGQGVFSAEHYNKYTKFGQSVSYYVWPPLRTHKHGILLSKGIAEGR